MLACLAALALPGCGSGHRTEVAASKTGSPTSAIVPVGVVSKNASSPETINLERVSAPVVLPTSEATADPPGQGPPKDDHGASPPAGGPRGEAATLPPVLSTADLVARVEPSVAIIASDQSHGTGFLVREGLLVTNAHVVEGAAEEDLTARFPSAPEGKRGPFRVRLVNVQLDRDLAFLEVDTDLPPIELAQQYPFRKGEDVLIVGSPGVGPEVVLENAVTRGILSTRAVLDGNAYYQLSASVNPGNSGGPVFDARGRVIGVVTLRASQQEALAFCVPIEDLQAAIRGLEPPGSDAGPASGLLSAPLRYRLEPGQVLAYEVEVNFGEPASEERWEATGVYRVMPGTPKRGNLEYRGSLEHRGGGSRSESVGRTDLALDARGSVVEAGEVASLPLLGDLAALPFHPLPIGRETTWRIEDDLVLRKSETSLAPGALGFAGGIPSLDRFGFGDRFGSGIPRLSPGFPRMPGGGIPFGGPRPGITRPEVRVSVTELPARERTDYDAEAPRESTGVVLITMRHRLETEERVGQGPLLRLTGEGEIRFDTTLGLPRSIEFDGTIAEATQGQAPTRTPIGYRVRLLEGREQARAIARADASVGPIEAPGANPGAPAPETVGELLPDGIRALPGNLVEREQDGFQDLTPDGGHLAGVRVTFGDFGGVKLVGAVRPIYRVGDDLVEGAWRGRPTGEPTEVLARPGYAVGAIHTRTGLLLDGLQLVFMRIKGNGLDPDDTYDGPWLGNTTGGGPASLSGAGRRVLGLQGRAGNELRALGLLVDGSSDGEG